MKKKQALSDPHNFTERHTQSKRARDGEIGTNICSKRYYFRIQITSSLRKQRRASHSLHKELILILNSILFLRIRKNRPKPFLFIIVNPKIKCPNTKAQTSKGQQKFKNRVQLNCELLKGLVHKRRISEPGIEISGKINESLQTQFLIEIGFIDGKCILCSNATVLRGLLLK